MTSFGYNGYYSYQNYGSGIRNYISPKVRELGEFLLYSSLFLGAAAVGMAYTSCFIQGIAWTGAIAAVMFMLVFSVYNLNRKTDEAEDKLNHERRFRITKKFERYLFVAALVAYLTALIIAALHGAAAFCVATIPLLSGISYSAPILPRWWRYHRLKEIPVMKNLVVSSAWGLSFSLLPVYLSGSTPTTATLVTFMFIFSWTFVASVLPDIRDRAGDSATGVATIPVLVGVAKSRNLLTAENIAVGACILALGRSVFPVRVWAVIICSLLYSQACILSIDRTGRNNFLCDVISDGQFLAIGGLCLLVLSFPGMIS
jgi:4-hydroxybenzoate polyprenyltransferase